MKLDAARQLFINEAEIGSGAFISIHLKKAGTILWWEDNVQRVPGREWLTLCDSSVDMQEPA